jgi:23S rRNA (uracil1939-C5)-methyltransferase
VAFINENNIEARPLKSVIIRSDASGTVGLTLFVNDASIAERFNGFKHSKIVFEIVFSNPKSPASVTTDVIVPATEVLSDSLLGRDFTYSARSFFQVNIPVYSAVLKEIANEVVSSGQTNVLDMYSGVGSIGLSVVSDEQNLTMVEISQESTDQAKRNMVGRDNCKIVTATAESALEHFTGDKVVILDPPRAGLHSDVTERLCSVKPPTIVYLSCNPSTQARDVRRLLEGGYKITHARGYNFFPRTPHIESLIILKRV